ncbi:MAG: DUF2189 domain-containing protein, partial [Hyphomicrobium sp.]|nr:DUF2189 domain-containing protein [Hyphomicrobium sp.]
IRRIGVADLKDALRLGLADFNAMPTHAMFLCLIYPVVGLLLARLAFGYSVLPLLYPLVTGFALVGPLAALGLYELSRRREAGEPTSVSHAFDVLQSSSIGGIVALGLLLMVMFAIWIAIANAIYIADFGYGTPVSIGAFVHDVLTTGAGWHLIVVGNLMGFIIGRSFFIEGLFARLMYRSLYKMHEMALHGPCKVILDTLSRMLTRRTEPVVKLH